MLKLKDFKYTFHLVLFIHLISRGIYPQRNKTVNGYCT